MPSTVRSIPSRRDNFGIALAAERAAVANAERDTEIDGGFLALDLPVPFGAVGMREIRRET